MGLYKTQFVIIYLSVIFLQFEAMVINEERPLKDRNGFPSLQVSRSESSEEGFRTTLPDSHYGNEKGNEDGNDGNDRGNVHQHDNRFGASFRGIENDLSLIQVPEDSFLNSKFNSNSKHSRKSNNGNDDHHRSSRKNRNSFEINNDNGNDDTDDSNIFGDSESDAESDRDYSLLNQLKRIFAGFLKADKKGIDLLPKIITTSSRILEAIIDFKDQWLEEIWDSATWQELNIIFPEASDCNGIMEILPCLNPFEESSDIVEISRHSLSLLMSYTVALESIILDEVLHENRLVLMSNYDVLLKELKPLVLGLMELLEANEETPDKHVIRKLASHVYRSESHSVDRKIRATAFLRQFEKGVVHIIELVARYDSALTRNYHFSDEYDNL